MTQVRNPEKDRLVDIAARATYEALKTFIADEEFAQTRWDQLPDSDGPLPSPVCKAYYREQVSTGVEALWRAGAFKEEAYAA